MTREDDLGLTNFYPDGYQEVRAAVYRPGEIRLDGATDELLYVAVVQLPEGPEIWHGTHGVMTFKHHRLWQLVHVVSDALKNLGYGYALTFCDDTDRLEWIIAAIDGGPEKKPPRFKVDHVSLILSFGGEQARMFYETFSDRIDNTDDDEYRRIMGTVNNLYNQESSPVETRSFRQTDEDIDNMAAFFAGKKGMTPDMAGRIVEHLGEDVQDPGVTYDAIKDVAFREDDDVSFIVVSDDEVGGESLVITVQTLKTFAGYRTAATER